MNNLKNYLSQKVEVIIDRQLGSAHPDHGYVYPVNYGYIPGTISLDGEPIDVYVLGISEPIKTFAGICIAIIHRMNDKDDKLVVAENGMSFSDSEIIKATRFQEQYFNTSIIR